MYIETQILGDKENHNTMVRFGFESYEEVGRAIGCITVAKEVYIDPGDKTGKIILPVPMQSKGSGAEPRVFKADNISMLTSELTIRSRQLQPPSPNQQNMRFLGPHKSRVLWLILNAVNSSELRVKVENHILPEYYSSVIEDSMYLMRAIGAGKKIGKITISQLLNEPKLRPIELHESVLAYEETESFSASFPLNVKATIATSLFDQYP